ncbi:hypothetical protein D3C75_952480 [compost metagenome]
MAARKEKSRADDSEKRLYFLEIENEILKNNIKVLVETQKESESLIQQKDREIYHLKKSIEALLMHRGMDQVHNEPDLTRVQPEHERSYYSLKEQKNISDSVERERG